MTLHRSEFLIYEEFFVFFFISVAASMSATGLCLEFGNIGRENRKHLKQKKMRETFNDKRKNT
jgi:hypothetical protein